MTQDRGSKVHFRFKTQVNRNNNKMKRRIKEWGYHGGEKSTVTQNSRECEKEKNPKVKPVSNGITSPFCFFFIFFCISLQSLVDTYYSKKKFF